MYLVWLIVAVAAFWFFKRYFIVSINGKRIIGEPERSTPAPPLPSHGDVDVIEITGESHYQNTFITLFGRPTQAGYNEFCGAELVREIGNKYDKNAVRCEIGGQQVGYVNRDEAGFIAKWMDKRKIHRLAVNATVRGGWKRSATDQGAFGVTVEIKPEVLEA